MEMMLQIATVMSLSAIKPTEDLMMLDLHIYHFPTAVHWHFSYTYNKQLGGS